MEKERKREIKKKGLFFYLFPSLSRCCTHWLVCVRNRAVNDDKIDYARNTNNEPLLLPIVLIWVSNYFNTFCCLFLLPFIYKIK